MAKRKEKDITKIDLNSLFRKIPKTLQAGNLMGIEEHYQLDWDWEIAQETIDYCMKTDGFIYKCIADNRSTRQQHMDFGFYAGRNIVERIFKCEPFGHLASDTIEIFYPESGLSANDQARFVWMCTKHPDWHMVKELRIVTRSPFFVSDCKAPFARVLSEETYTSSVKDAVFKTIESRDKFTGQRIAAQRPSMDYAEKEIKLLYLWGAKERRIIFYLGEDDNQVYWVDPGDLTKVYRSTHYNMWYEVNALWCNTLTPDQYIDHLKGENLENFLDKIINDITIPEEVLALEIKQLRNKRKKKQ